MFVENMFFENMFVKYMFVKIVFSIHVLVQVQNLDQVI